MTAPTATPVAGGRLVQGGAPVTTLQPILAAATPVTVTSDQLATLLLYDGLIRVHPLTAAPEPRLGEWELAADGRMYSWRIAANARWSDGAPLTATDWLTGIKAIARSAKALPFLRSRFAEIEGFVEFAEEGASEIGGVVLDPDDPKRMTVRLTRSLCPSLINVFGGNYLLPTHVFGKYVAADMGDAIDRAPENDEPRVTSGPFMLGEWRRGDQLRLVRNPTYWAGAPLLDEYVLREGAAGADGIRSGSTNFATPSEPIEIPGRFTTLRSPSSGYTFIAWNTKSETAPALRDKRVRQALAYATDWDAVIQQLFQGEASRVFSHHAPSAWAYPGGLNEYRHDPARAEALLATAGYARGPDGILQKAGHRLAFTIVANEENLTRKAILQLAATQYGAIGIEATPRLTAFRELVTAIQTADPTLESYILGLDPSADPDPFPAWHSTMQSDRSTGRKGVNLPFSAVGLDGSIEQGREGPDCSIARRKVQYAAFNRILNDEQPYSFGYATTKFFAVPVELRGFVPSAWFGAVFYDIHKWWMEPAGP